MKPFLLILILFPLFSFSQIPINSDGIAEYTDVVQVDTTSADVLYSRAKVFTGQAANSARDVIKVADDLSRTMVIKGIMDVIVRDPRGLQKYGYIRLSITVSCKDTRYKYSIKDIVYQPISRGVDNGPSKLIESEKIYVGIGGKKATADVKESVDKMLRDFIASLKADMAKNNSDW